ncbi:MAG: restriction endonuclease, partial [Frankia sp.]|nr:restriction endonuclease [Frankia sp.]
PQPAAPGRPRPAAPAGDRGAARPTGGLRRRLRVGPTRPRRAPLDLMAMDPYDFERLVASLTEAMGYTTERTGRSGDGGVDIEVHSNDPLASGLIVISVKRLKRTVPASHVRELAGTVHDRGAIKGILVTTSTFGPSSYDFAAKNRLELVDGARLRAWLAEYLQLDAV